MTPLWTSGQSIPGWQPGLLSHDQGMEVRAGATVASVHAGSRPRKRAIACRTGSGFVLAPMPGSLSLQRGHRNGREVALAITSLLVRCLTMAQREASGEHVLAGHCEPGAPEPRQELHVACLLGQGRGCIAKADEVQRHRSESAKESPRRAETSIAPVSTVPWLRGHSAGSGPPRRPRSPARRAPRRRRDRDR